MTSFDTIISLFLSEIKVCVHNHRYGLIDYDHVNTIKDSIRNGCEIPPLLIHRCPNLPSHIYGIYDGQHRYEAYRQMNYLLKITCLLTNNTNLSNIRDTSFNANRVRSVSYFDKCKHAFEIFTRNHNLTEVMSTLSISEDLSKDYLCKYEFLDHRLLHKVKDGGKIRDGFINVGNSDKLMKIFLNDQAVVYNFWCEHNNDKIFPPNIREQVSTWSNFKKKHILPIKSTSRFLRNNSEIISKLKEIQENKDFCLKQILSNYNTSKNDLENEYQQKLLELKQIYNLNDADINSLLSNM